MTTETKQALQDNGYDSLKEYLQDMADEYGLEYEFVRQLASIMGEGELFDGLVTALEDAEGYGM